ncbi:MAG: hypothetical protein HY901_15625, partial [Deltaproteobacteria bacterium]|nr:hypothetical protein [Deltaproteobacteria bacterium]
AAGKANGAAGVVARAGLNARTVAVGQACHTVLKINGSAHSAGTSIQKGKRMAYLYRKSDCADTNTNFDYIADDLPLQAAELPGVVVSTNLGAADSLSTLIVYHCDAAGLCGNYTVWQSSGGGYSMVSAPSSGLLVTFDVGGGGGVRSVLFPPAGSPRVQ